MAELTPELFETHISIFKTEDLQKKMHIATNIFKKFEIKNMKNSTDLLTACQSITGVPRETLLVVQSLESKSIKFEDWLSEQKQMLHSSHYEYANIRKILLKKYTQLLEIPTGIKDDKKYEGYKNFFTLVQIPGTEFSIIVEKPGTVMERHRFLHAKMMHREQMKNIVYIGKINLILNCGKFSFKEDNIESRSRFIIAVSAKFGYVSYIYNWGLDPQYFTNWIEEKIIPQLQEESVIIFQENVLDITDDSLSSDLLKEDIINVLKSNNIKHDPNMHRADLYKLLKKLKYCRKEPLSSVELNLRAQGHITIRKKCCNINNNYFDPFWIFFIHELNKSNELECMRTTNSINFNVVTKFSNVVVQKVPLDYWKNLENILIEKELEIYKQDLEMEHVIDKLMTMLKNEGIPKEWEKQGMQLDRYDKSMEQSFMILSDNLLKLYSNLNKTQRYKTLNIFK